METHINANPVEVIKKDIYLIENKLNHKKYIGQAINVKNRLKRHRSGSLEKNPSLIHAAIKKYGWENFFVTILEH